MFVYSVKASTVRFIGVLILCITCMIVVIGLAGTSDAYAQVSGGEINYGNIKTEEDRIAFIEQFGLKVKRESATSESFSVPTDFDRVISGYNEIQKSQGLDITKYKNKKVTRYSYEVTGYESEGTVYVNLCVYKNKIIACDISGAGPDGFVSPLVTGESIEGKAVR